MPRLPLLNQPRILECVHCALSCWTLYWAGHSKANHDVIAHLLFQYTVINYGCIECLFRSPPVLAVSGVLAMIISTVVKVSTTSHSVICNITSPQVYFVYRLRELSTRNVIPIICAVLTIGQFCVFAYLMYKQIVARRLPPQLRWVYTSIGMLSVVNDLFVGIFLCYCKFERWMSPFHYMGFVAPFQPVSGTSNSNYSGLWGRSTGYWQTPLVSDPNSISILANNFGHQKPTS